MKNSAWETDKKTGRQKRVCPVSQHPYFRQMVDTAIANRLPCRYLLADTWFASAQNLVYLKHECQTDFIFPLKEHRKVALSPQDKEQGRYGSVWALLLEANPVLAIWLEGVDFPLLLSKQVFTNKDGSQGVLYLVTSDLNVNALQIQTIYQKRGQVEVYHKSLKSNASFSQSPTRTIRTQSNHFFACLWASVKLERLRLQTKRNPFAMKAKSYQAALASAYQQLQGLKAGRLSA